MSPSAKWAACTALAMVLLWVTEALPLAVTALLPLVLFPLFEILPLSETASTYTHHFIFLFMGGFLLSLAIERWGLHQRIAINIIRWVGLQPRNLIAGFMIAVAFLSMWISNTAAVIMMLPIAMSVISMQEKRDPTNHRFAVALLISIAAAANIGGMATLIGSPPNTLFAGFISETYHIEIGFGQWLLFAGPLASVLLIIAWVLIVFVVFRLNNTPPSNCDTIDQEALRFSKPWSREEKFIGLIFLSVVVLWIFRLPLVSSSWLATTSPLLHTFLSRLSDTSIAIGAGILLFAVPANDPITKQKTTLLNWDTAKKMPWDILLLFGGGLALSKSITSTGLDQWVGSQLSILSNMPIWTLVFMSAIIICVLTELASNTAITAAFLPILYGLAIAIHAPACHLLLPTVFAASCAFMLPVATPPNAIVFGSGHLHINDMMKAGWILNIVCALIISIAVLLFGELLLSTESGT